MSADENPRNALTVDEIAARYGKHRVSVQRWLRSGQLQGRKVGRTWIVEESDLAAFLARERDERSRTSTGTPPEERTEDIAALQRENADLKKRFAQLAEATGLLGEAKSAWELRAINAEYQLNQLQEEVEGRRRQVERLEKKLYTAAKQIERLKKQLNI